MEDGSQRGVVSVQEAIKLAEDAGFDLVEIAPTAKPPVCKIMDFSKFKFEKAKKEKEAKKKQKLHQIDIKEIKFRPKIEEHDYSVKLKHIKRFLEDGDKVKIVVRYRGREMMFLDKGLELFDKLAKDLENLCVIEKKPEMQGRQQTMVIGPKGN